MALVAAVLLMCNFSVGSFPKLNFAVVRNAKPNFNVSLMKHGTTLSHASRKQVVLCKSTTLTSVSRKSL